MDDGRWTTDNGRLTFYVLRFAFQAARDPHALFRRRLGALAISAGAVRALRSLRRPGLRAAAPLLLGRAAIVGRSARLDDRRCGAARHLSHADARYSAGDAAPGGVADMVRVRPARCPAGAARLRRAGAAVALRVVRRRVDLPGHARLS